MSTNIHFLASREITVNRTGKTDTQTRHLQVWQSNSEETRKIMQSTDPVQGYVDWVIRRFDQDEQEPVYAEDDVFGQRDPVRFETYNPGRQHAAEFLRTVEELRADGWDIKAEAW